MAGCPPFLLQAELTGRGGRTEAPIEFPGRASLCHLTKMGYEKDRWTATEAKEPIPADSPSPAFLKKKINKESFSSLSTSQGDRSTVAKHSAHGRRLPGQAPCASVSSCVKRRWWWSYASSRAVVRTQSDYPGSGFLVGILSSWQRVHAQDLFVVNSPIPRYRRSLGLHSLIKPSWHQMK